ncbi:MAG: hypothetical protein EXX96DRAFT_466179, partial [Benjaminiella poitrasii]
QEIGDIVPKAAEACGVPTSSVYKLLDEFSISIGTILPGSTLKQKGKKLFPIHTAFLIQ